MFVNRGGIDGKPAEELASNPLPGDAWRVRPSTDHMANFFECVKTRQQPISHIESAVRSDTICHLADIAIRTGRKLRWDPKDEQFENDDEATRLLTRSLRSPWRL